MQEGYDKLCGEIRVLSAELDNEKAELSNLQEERIRIEGEYNLVSQQLLTAKNDLSELINEKNSSDERISVLEKSIEEKKKHSDKLSDDIHTAEQGLLALSGRKTELSQKREEISTEISKLNLDVHGADRDLAARHQAMGLLKARLVNQEDRDKELDKEIEYILNKNKEIEAEIEQLKLLTQNLHNDVERSKEDISLLHKKRSEIEGKSQLLRSQERARTTEREQIGGEKARLEERRETMLREYDDIINKLYDEYQLTKREAEAVGEKPEDPKGAQRRLHELKNSIRHLGSVNLGAIEEYKEVKERYEFMSGQVEDVEKSKKELIRLIEELTYKMSHQFREQFVKINENFNETFRELFGGGKAELVLEDEMNVLECDIEIKVQPPGKNVQNISLLSGGEKGLSAIALLFSILKINPCPFCIFDEVEAALDDVNVARYASYVRRMTDNTQFILITHRRGTMEEADMLYGVTMQEKGITKLLELNVSELEKKLLENQGA